MRPLVARSAILCGLVWLLAAGPCAPSAWYVYTVDSADDVGGYSSVALDANGYPHISYLDSTNEALKYARWNGSGWDVQTVDSVDRVGWWGAIALDASDYPHISYQDYGGGAGLKYARWNGSSWDIQVVESGPGTGYDTCIVLDSKGYPHISYYHDWPDFGLKYAKWSGTKWKIQMVDSGFDVGYWTSIALDANDHPHISYCDNAAWTVKYAAWNGSTWDTQTIDEGGGDSSLALDSSGHPHISYPADVGLGYAAWNGTMWNIQPVDASDAHHVSIGLDSQDHPRIAYSGGYYRWLRYAAWNGSTWDVETADTAGYATMQPSLALDAAGHVHISYRDTDAHALKYATTRLPADGSHALAAAGYYMISFPLTPPAGTTVDELLCDDLGHGSYYMWQWYGGRYHSVPTALPDCQHATVRRQDGCWLLAPAATLHIGTGGTMPHGDQSIALVAGWNMIAVLYEATMDSLLVDNGGDVRSLADAESAGWVLARFYYCHDGTGTYSTLSVNQTPADSLSLWHSYWVLAALDWSLIVPQTSMGGTTASRSRQPASAPLAWTFDIAASSGGSSDSITIAAADRASDDFDGFALDTPKPPASPVENALRVVLRPTRGADSRGLSGPSELAMETKGTGPDALQWEFVVAGGRLGETIRLSWPGLHRLPRDQAAILIDQDTDKRTFMRTRAQYEFAAPGSGGARSFSVRVTPARHAGQLISGFSVVPLRGRPGAEMAFGLSAEATVDISVLNVAGRLVQRVRQGFVTEAGAHTVAWPGRSASSTALPNGTYLCVLQARGTDGHVARAVRPISMAR